MVELRRWICFVSGEGRQWRAVETDERLYNACLRALDITTRGADRSSKELCP